MYKSYYNSFITIIKPALQLAIIPIIYNTSLLVLGLLPHYHGEDWGYAPSLTTIFLLPVAIIVTIVRQKRADDGIMYLKDAIRCGVILAIMATLLIILYDILFNAVLAPYFKAQYYDAFGHFIKAHFEESSANPEVDYKNHVDRMMNAGVKNYSAKLIISALYALLISLLTGLIIKTRKR